MGNYRKLDKPQKATRSYRQDCRQTPEFSSKLTAGPNYFSSADGDSWLWVENRGTLKWLVLGIAQTKPEAQRAIWCPEVHLSQALPRGFDFPLVKLLDKLTVLGPPTSHPGFAVALAFAQVHRALCGFADPLQRHHESLPAVQKESSYSPFRSRKP